MNILYLDSNKLNFGFDRFNGSHTVESIDSFRSVIEVSDFFQSRIGQVDLILYNPHIFVFLIETFDFDLEEFSSNQSMECIPYVNPKDILPLSLKIERHLTKLFPVNNCDREFDFVEAYKGKCVLVTGAGGSIGSELVKQLLMADVSSCCCLDLSEFSVFNLKTKLSTSDLHKTKIYVGSYGDTDLLTNIFKENKVDLIINAAAYKHVSIMQVAPYAALKNNVENFVSLLKTSSKHGVTNIIQVSTDKAAEPSNVMGFSKFLCEQILINVNKYLDTQFTYSIVRFGNVVGSSGSVAPIFVDNIKQGKNLKVTHNDVERFMMQINDAVGLILRAARNPKNETYVLDMGKPYKIKALAVKMLKNSVFTCSNSLFEYTGLEEGEKLSEVLLTPEEQESCVFDNGVLVIQNRKNVLLSDEDMRSIFEGDTALLFRHLDHALM
ncbi:polysaccharide biosynthesis protein [Porticoccaceae bacterium]|nr:polysaccharide biosynthesis protein [Porticoccaceae bacterium]